LIVELGPSVMMAASVAVEAHSLLACDACSTCRVAQSVTEGWTARWVITSGVVDGYDSAAK
jgi:hypothetical protein